MDRSERDALLTLLLTAGFGHRLVGRSLERFGSALATLEVTAGELAQLKRVGATKAADLRRRLDQTLSGSDLAREHELRGRYGVELVALGQRGYPQLLQHIPDPPQLLWVRGSLRDIDALALAIVGSRRCTHYGREQADRFASLCAQAGLCIVSGGAYGIDAAAHRGALRAGGRTVAVLGCGLANPYPPEHIELFDQIAGPPTGKADRGAVLSELPMTAPPIAENFPRRNRLISGLALGVLVVEAAARSGAQITARLCVEEHGREAMAVPGRVDSQASAGCHKMLQDGCATLVTGVADVLDALGEAGQLLKAGAAASTDEPARPGLLEKTLSEPQRKIIEALEHPRSLDQVAVWTELPVARVQAELTLLEIRGSIRRLNSFFVRC